MNPTRPYWLFLVALCGIFGCGQSGPKTYPVTGIVRYQGKPLPLGIVMFVADNGPSSQPGVIDPQGRYRLDAVAGSHRVAIVAIPPRTGGRPDPTKEGGFDYTGVPDVKPLVPPKYSRHTTSGVTVTVEPTGENEIDIDLQ